MLVIVKEEWRVTDRWWTDDPICTEWIETIWDDRVVVFYKRSDEKVWRIWNSVIEER